MKDLLKLKEEVQLRKARAGGSSVLTLIDMDTVIELIERLEAASEHLSQVGGVDPEECYKLGDEIQKELRSGG